MENKQPFTFGDTPASIKLWKMLLERNDKKEQKNVSSFLNEFNIGLKQIDIISDKRFSYCVLVMWEENFFNRITKFDPMVGSYVKNIIKSKTKNRKNNYINTFRRLDNQIKIK